MVCILKTTFIFCVFPFIKAVTLRIDGLVDLGPTWSYEYRILSPSENTQNAKHDIARHGKKHHRAKFPHPRGEGKIDEDHLRRDEERLQKAEERLRREAEEIRKNQHSRHLQVQAETHKQHPVSQTTHKHHQPTTKPHKHHRNTEEKHKKDKTPEFIQHEKNHKNRFPEIIIQQMPQLKEDSKLETKRDSETKPKREKESEPKREKKPEERNTSPKPSTWSSDDSDDDSTSLDSWEKTTKKAGTMFDMYDFTTTRKPKTRPTPEYEEKTNKKRHKGRQSVPVNEDIDSFVEDNNDTTAIKRELLLLAVNKTVWAVNMTSSKKNMPVTNATKQTTTQVTTVRTAEIFSSPHKVKDDAKINEFSNHIYKQTLKVFDSMKQKTSQYHLKKQIDVLARSYEDKFKEFLRETSHQKIKTRLGTQKVILNTIDMSNRILKRLINFMIGDLDKKGVLRHNVATANIFQKEIDKEQALELNHACKKFGICRTGNGFPEFLADIITILVRTEDKKFKQSIDALTEVVKNTDFNKAFDSRTEKKLKASIEKVEALNTATLRPMFMILKNIIMNKNRPLVINNAAARGRVNTTLAYLEIIDLLDQKMPQNEVNTLEWNDLKTSLSDFSSDKRYDVQDIMEVFVKHLKKTLRTLDPLSHKIISKNLNIILR